MLLPCDVVNEKGQDTGERDFQKEEDRPVLEIMCVH